ncbi:MOB kinase activator 3C [Eurytemora carolleeae]|uniref:MOB kinase activator 3C n=1 Tax=Eurytemora carolleeae TaxID=1294199 RepID=UPI000C7648E2|nr:MOB kinase activator 3C [Eurytemora carolleeae]|eukprot:XP_023346750.1 MOB kinase activator 3C-like [Eurytemora affinis]
MKKVAFMLSKSDAATSKVKKRYERGSHRYSLYKHSTTNADAGVNVKDLVRLPPNEDLNDFLATNLVDFYNRIKLLYSTVVEESDVYKTKACSEESCPKMSGGPKYEYLWQDDKRNKKPVQMTAPDYIITLIEWVDDIINDEQVFPSCDDVPFPKNFKDVISRIFRRLYRVFVHIYYHHFDRLNEIKAEVHANALYKQFYCLSKEYNLISAKDYEPLQDLTRRICSDVK